MVEPNSEVKKVGALMKLVKLIKVIETLETLKNKYDDLRGLMEDQVRDNQIEEAKETFKEILEFKKSIEQMENLDVQVG